MRAISTDSINPKNYWVSVEISQRQTAYLHSWHASSGSRYKAACCAGLGLWSCKMGCHCQQLKKSFCQKLGQKETDGQKPGKFNAQLMSAFPGFHYLPTFQYSCWLNNRSWFTDLIFHQANSSSLYISWKNKLSLWLAKWSVFPVTFSFLLPLYFLLLLFVYRAATHKTHELFVQWHFSIQKLNI